MRQLLSFERRLAEAWPPAAWRDVSVLVAVSGGADSVALLRALCRLKQETQESPGAGRLVVGHVNHQLRPEADQDEAFVRTLAQELRLDCQCSRLEPSAFHVREGLEAAARDARYARLADMAHQHAARYVVTGHTADDQAETILHRIVRGTGLAGLAGMPRARSLSAAVTLLRPMLNVTRAEVLSYLGGLAQTYRVDATNEERDFTRNRIRHELLPLLERQYNPEVKQALLRLGSLAGEAQGVIDALSEELRARTVHLHDAHEVRIDCRPLRQEPPYLVRELLAGIWRTRGWPQQAMGYEEWRRLAAMALAPATPAVPQQIFPGQIIARREAEDLMLERRKDGRKDGRKDECQRTNVE